MSEPFKPELTPEARDELIAELCDENNTLRAELAAERERNAAPSEYDLALMKERDALRALLREARVLLLNFERTEYELIARIDALLNGGGDE